MPRDKRFELAARCRHYMPGLQRREVPIDERNVGVGESFRDHGGTVCVAHDGACALGIEQAKGPGGPPVHARRFRCVEARPPWLPPQPDQAWLNGARSAQHGIELERGEEVVFSEHDDLHEDGIELRSEGAGAIRAGCSQA
jgi:hypothetical protein